MRRKVDDAFKLKCMELYELYRQGISLLDSRDYHQAIVPLKKALAIEPQTTSIREALGLAYFHSHFYEQAAHEFAAVVKHAPTNDYALFCLGRSLQLMGEHRRAQGPLALAKSMRPDRNDYRHYHQKASERGINE